jgi:hypothetical protein
MLQAIKIRVHITKVEVRVRGQKRRIGGHVKRKKETCARIFPRG